MPWRQPSALPRARRLAGRQRWRSDLFGNRVSDEEASMSLTFIRGVAFVLAVLMAGAAAPVAQVPEVNDRAIPFDRSTAMWLVTLPLGCIDKLHDAPRSRGY